MAMAARLLLGNLLLLCPVRAGEDKFIPPDLAHITLMGCFIGGHPDSADAIVIAEYGSVRERWQVLMARRQRAHEALDDCKKWAGDMSDEFKKAAKR